LTHSERLTHKAVTRQPWIRCRSGKVRQLQTDVLTRATLPDYRAYSKFTDFRGAATTSHYENIARLYSSPSWWVPCRSRSWPPCRGYVGRRTLHEMPSCTLEPSTGYRRRSVRDTEHTPATSDLPTYNM